MNEFTSEEILSIVSKAKLILDKARVVAITIAQIQKLCENDPPEEAFLKVDFDGPCDVTATFDERACRRGCCGSQGHDLTFPIAYLWMPDYVEVETKRFAEETERLKRFAEAEEEQETLERNTYERLKKKFE